MDPSDVTASAIVEPRYDMEFESHEDAYSFYREYAKSAGFGTAKLSSRRSRSSKEFIDAKFSCIRYGNKQQSDDAVNPRPSPKIGCKASMHVKRRPDGKWYVFSFIKEHNHELLPSQAHFFRCHRKAESSKTDGRIRRRKNLALLPGQSNMYQHLDCLENYLRNPHDKGRSLVIEPIDAQMLLELLMQMQEENPKFFYAVDLNEEHRLRNVFWVDAKGVEDFCKFGDVVCIDTSYFANKYKIPLVLFVGVNHHIQPTLYGCALIADDTVYTFVWLVQTWFVAMGSRAPQSILTDQIDSMKVAIATVLPDTRHCFCLWYILDKIPRQQEYLSLWHDAFMEKFNKCIFQSWAEVEFEKRWWKLLDRFNLREVEWVRLLYEDRGYWVPTFMREVSFAGLSSVSRTQSLNYWFDKYINPETSLREFVEKYKAMLEDRYEEEAKADFDAWHETPELKSPSPFEKQVSLVYTREIFKKFQVEVLGAAACHLKKENEDARSVRYTVKDIENNLNYVVEWNELNSSIYCSCHSFEYKGYLCRHAIVVLQMSGVFSIPPRYILQRWTNAALSKHAIISEKLEEVQSKMRRYNDLCRRAIILGEEGSLSHESYDLALCSVREALKQCAAVNSKLENESRADASASPVICDAEEENQGCNPSTDEVSGPKIRDRSKVPRNTDTGKEKTKGVNYGNKKGKVAQLDSTRGSAQEDLHQMVFTDARSAHMQHNMVPTTLHHAVPTMFHNSMPTQFNVASIRMHENALPR